MFYSKCSSTLEVPNSATEPARDICFFWLESSPCSGFSWYRDAGEWERGPNCWSHPPDVGE